MPPSKKVKVPKPEDAVPVVAEPVQEVQEVVVEAEAVAEPVTTPLARLDEKIHGMYVMFKELAAELKVMKKEYDRMRKIVDRSESKRAKARSNPNGFAKPAEVTVELCRFLGLPDGTLISRTDVTRRINAYIREHSLNKPENRRYIMPDDQLRSILGTAAGEEISYFQLQKYISRSFVKA